MQIALTREFLLKFLKFGVVGFSGVFVNFGITYVCKEWLKWNKYLSNILGFVGIDTLTVYLLNGKLKWNFYLSKVFAIGFATLWNFFGNLLFTFA